MGDVFTKLIDNNILCVPVYEGKEFQGFIDILDIVAALCPQIHTDSNTPTLQEQWETWHTLSKLSSLPCSSAINASGRNPKLEMLAETPLQQVIDMFSIEDVHRVGIMDSEGHIMAILTQFQVLRFLLQHGLVTEMGNLAVMPLEQLRLGYRDVYTVHENTRSLEAFNLIIEKKISGVGIVNDEGNLVGNISASDLKDIGYNYMLFGKLFISVSEFMKQKLAGNQLPSPLVVYPKTTMKEVLDMFVANRVHRLYVCEEGTSKILGVVTPLDIIECFKSRPSPLPLVE
jgi:CBS domain-containing protein